MKFKTSSLTAERLRELLDYDPLTGVFTRKARRQSVNVGDQVRGCPNSQGYLRIRADWTEYLAHRLAWLHVHGEWPAEILDHINGDKADNRIANLRLATASQNNCNRRTPSRTRTSSGLLGVMWDEPLKKWRASIKIGRRATHLGVYATAEEAHVAYLKAKREMHDFCTI